MAEGSQNTGVINLPPQQPPSNPLLELVGNQRVKKLIFDIAEKQIKDMAGIETERGKHSNKSPFGRTMATVKDFLQGTWWIFVLGTFFMGLVIIGLKWIAKMAGV